MCERLLYKNTFTGPIPDTWRGMTSMQDLYGSSDLPLHWIRGNFCDFSFVNLKAWLIKFRVPADFALVSDYFSWCDAERAMSIICTGGFLRGCWKCLQLKYCKLMWPWLTVPDKFSCSPRIRTYAWLGCLFSFRKLINTVVQCITSFWLK